MPARRGIALLLVLLLVTVLALVALALRHTSASDARARRLARASQVVAAHLDSLGAAAVAAVHRDPRWRGSRPGEAWAGARSPDGRWVPGRASWAWLLIAVEATQRTGTPGLDARRTQSLLLPIMHPALGDPLVLLEADTLGAPAGALTIPAPGPDEVACRGGGTPVAEAPTTWRPEALDSLAVADPDTLGDTVSGALRLRTAPRRPLLVRGVLVLEADVPVATDLRVEGLLVLPGPAVLAGGRLLVRGGVRLRGAAGRLPPASPAVVLHYDACAIRAALDRAGRLGPPAPWSTIAPG